MNNLTDYLQSIEEQEVQEEARIQVVRNSKLDALLKNYEKWLKETDPVKNSIDSEYNRAIKLVANLGCTRTDVRNFSILLKQYESDALSFFETGFYLSAMINSSKEKNFDILTNHLEVKIDRIGFVNEKNVIINGDVGEHTGISMQSGKIIVEGNAEVYTGFQMNGGELLIKGNTDDVGEEMYGGKIIVEGNAEGWVGENSVGGIICVKGEIEYISDDCMAKVYQRGKRVK